MQNPNPKKLLPLQAPSQPHLTQHQHLSLESPSSKNSRKNSVLPVFETSFQEKTENSIDYKELREEILAYSSDQAKKNEEKLKNHKRGSVHSRLQKRNFIKIEFDEIYEMVKKTKLEANKFSKFVKSIRTRLADEKKESWRKKRRDEFEKSKTENGDDSEDSSNLLYVR